ncbi:MAG: hypothetical protein R3C10_23850, partial [Pirellulales bacterium]
MSVELPEGRYQATVCNQWFDETKTTGKQQFCLEIEVQAELVGGELKPIENPKRRTIYRCLEGNDYEGTSVLLDWFRSDLKYLGFDDLSRRLSDLDLDSANGCHHSFVGQEITVTCRHDTYNDKLQERWDVYQPRQSTPVDKEKMEWLDTMFDELIEEHEPDVPAQA